MPISCAMTQEFKAHSYQYNAESPEEAQTLALMKVRAQFAKTSKRTTMARFASLAGSLESNFGWWHVQLFDATVVALEEDMLCGICLRGQILHRGSLKQFRRHECSRKRAHEHFEKPFY